MDYAAVAVISYLIGAIPTGYLVAKQARGIDIRSIGSGKTGATNILRSIGPAAFAFVFTFDFLKGFLCVLLAGQLTGNPMCSVVAGLAALVGHTWPVYIGFQGGRGVATGLGGAFAMAPVLSAVAVGVAVIMIAATRYMSMGSILGSSLVMVFSIISVIIGAQPLTLALYTVPGVLLIIVQHKDNLLRLQAGTERKLGDTADPR